MKLLVVVIILFQKLSYEQLFSNNLNKSGFLMWSQ